MNRFSPPKIGYVLKCFPRLSETFVLNELLELERQETALQIYSLSDPAQGEPVRHGMLGQLATPVIYLPSKQALKKQWRIKHGRYCEGAFAERPWRDVCGADIPRKSVRALQAALVGVMAWAQDVTHLHAHFATDATTVARLASRLTNIPYSFTAHAKDIYHQSVDRTLLRQKIRGARFVVTVSEANREYLVKLAGLDAAGKIFRIYNGIDLDRFRPDPSVPREPGLILAVGRLEPKKGFRTLIEACGLLRGRGVPFRCLIVGEGGQQAPLAQQIRALGVQDHVILAGAQPQEQLVELFRRARVFVLPCVIDAHGDRDGLPTVLLEALAAGLPAVSTTLAGIEEIIEHARTGLLAPPGDAAGLAGAIREILTNPELERRLSREGRLKAEKDFDARKNTPVLRDLFAGSIGGREPRLTPQEAR